MVELGLYFILSRRDLQNVTYKGNSQFLRITYNMKVRDVIRLLEQDGWYLSRTRGSHRQFKHSLKSGLVTVPGKLSDDLAIKTLRSIFKQAQLNKYLEEGDNN